jgi:Trk-type K+ transport system membrane component
VESSGIKTIYEILSILLIRTNLKKVLKMKRKVKKEIKIRSDVGSYAGFNPVFIVK